MIIASIDIGTNTVLMLIAKINGNKIETLKNEHTIPRIGKGVSKGKGISDEKINDLIEILKRYKNIALEMNAEKFICTGTNVFRIASNSQYVVQRILEETGLHISIISGEDEAIYSFFGATDGNAKHSNLVIDIGGGSTELVLGENKKIIFRKSFEVGVVTGTEKYFFNDPPSKDQLNTFQGFLKETIINIPEDIKKPDNCIAIAGTPTTLACIKQNLTVYNEDLIEDSVLTKDEIDYLVKSLSKLTSSQILEKYKSVASGREDVLLSGTLILQYLMSYLNIKQVKVSTKGIRYGAIYFNEIFKDEYSGL